MKLLKFCAISLLLVSMAYAIPLNSSARSVVRRIPLGRQPEGVLIPPDGARAFVAVNGDNAIAVLDLKTWQVTKKLAPGRGPDGMAWVR